MLTPLQLFQNHEGLLTELSKSFTKINEILPRAQIQAELFEFPLMQRLMQDLFAALIQYLHGMLEFYEESKWTHAWKSLLQPFSIRFGEHVARIDGCSTSIFELAAALAYQEQRVIHRTIQRMAKTQDTMLAMMHNLQSSFAGNSKCRLL